MSEERQPPCEVGYLQLAPQLGAVQANLDRIDELLVGAHADLLGPDGFPVPGSGRDVLLNKYKVDALVVAGEDE